MTLIQQVKDLSQVVTAKCSEPQAVSGNANGEEAVQQTFRAYSLLQISPVRVNCPVKEGKVKNWGSEV